MRDNFVRIALPMYATLLATARLMAQGVQFNPPVLTNASSVPSLSLELNGGGGAVLYGSSNVVGPWSPIATNATNGQFVVPIAPSAGAGFYRAKTTYTRFYEASSFWNTPLATNAAIDPNSASMVQASLVNYASAAELVNSAYGVAMAYGAPGDKVYTVTATLYSSPSTGPGRPGVAFPIPAGTQAAQGNDGHLAIAYPAMDGSSYAGMELDIWQAVYDSTNDTWSGSTVVLENLYGWGATCPEGSQCTGACAAGFSLLGGVVRPEEIAQGHIDHALAIATPAILAGYAACPATESSDGSAPAPALPEGARIQLDPAFDVDAQSWPQWVKIIAHALQTYGAYTRDVAGILSVYGVTDENAGVPTWTSLGVPEEWGDLSVLPWGSIRVMLLRQCP